MFKINPTDNPPVYDPAIFKRSWEEQVWRMEARMKSTQDRLDLCGGLSTGKRIRLVKQIHHLQARILALKLSHA